MGKQGRRVRGSDREQFWRGEVEGQMASGVSVRVWCRRRGLSEPSFYHWRAELKRRTSATEDVSVPAAKRAKRPQSGAAPSFVPVRLTTSSSQVEFALASGLVIRVPAHDLAALRAILEVVEPRPC